MLFISFVSKLTFSSSILIKYDFMISEKNIFVNFFHKLILILFFKGFIIFDEVLIDSLILKSINSFTSYERGKEKC